MTRKKQYEAPAFRVVRLEVRAQILGVCQTSSPSSAQIVPGAGLPRPLSANAYRAQ